jgi:glycine cleavage system H protein
MDSSYSDKQYPIIRPKEVRCVWMDAGILSYQLCGREFDCDQCLLHIALRNHASNHQVEYIEQTQLSRTSFKQKLQNDFRYSRNHCWVSALDDCSVRFGIEPYLAAALIIPKDLVFLQVDQPVKKNQACFWIVTEGETFPIISPVDGKVLSVNSNLTSKPHELCIRPLDTGWLYELTTGVGALTAEEFMNPDEAYACYSSDEQRFKGLLSAVLKQNHPPVGVTLTDGGQSLQSISDVLGPRKYFSILQQAFGLKPSVKD